MSDLLELFEDIPCPLEEYREAIEDFRSYMGPEFPKLEIDRSDDIVDWKNQWGVYIRFGKNDQLLYIGSTLRRFQDREPTSYEPEWTALIIIPKKFWFFTRALETFLIDWFKPQFNERDVNALRKLGT